MPRRRPDTDDLARRFLQLDTGIRLAAAAGGLLPMQDRPESPAQTYPYDQSLQHPKPKPAQPTIKIGQLENVARSKPLLKTRSVSDPGDAHRLIARFVKADEKRAMTSDPSPSPRAFPFPSMAVRRSTTLENFLEMESSANDTGDDQLTRKMGQILARKAAAATRALSRSSGRRSVDSSGRRSINSSRRSSRLRVESTADARDAKRASLMPPKRESVIVDDRSPHEGAGPAWPLGFAPTAKGSSAPGAETGPRNERAVSISASRDSLRSFVFPRMPPELSPVQSTYFGSQPPDHFAAQPYTSPRLSIMTVPQFADDAQSFVVPASPASGVYVSPVESVAMFGSPVSVRFPASPVYSTSPVHVRTSPAVQISPSSVRIQTSPAALAQSPTRTRIQTSPVTALYQTPIAPYHPSPTARYQASPTTRFQSSPTARYQPSPTTIYSQPSPITPSHQRHQSDAHVNLLRGLSPLPTHGLPLPAPHALTLRARGSSMRDSFVSLASVDLAQVPETSLEHEASIVGRDPTSGREAAIRQEAASGREVATTGRETSALEMPMSPLYEMPTPIEAPQETPATSSSPSPVTALATTPTPPRSNPSPLPLAHVPHTAPHDQTSFQLPDPASFPIQFPRPSYSPSLHSRPITPHRFSRARSPLGDADEVVFRGSSSSTASTPQKRKRRRARLPVRANSESVVGRRGASDPRVRRTAQSLMRRTQTGEDRGEVSSDGRDVVLFVPRSLVPPVPSTPGAGERRSPPVEQVEQAPAVEEPVLPSPVERPVPPPLVRRESIPLPESLPPAGPPEHPELQKPIIEPPPVRTLAYLPWSPPRRVLSRPDMVSREGSFVTAPDSFDEDDFPNGLPGSWDIDARFASTPVRFVGTPVHMDLSELEESSAEAWRQSVATAAESRRSMTEDEQVAERATISSAMRGQVAQPVTMTRRPSGDFAPVRGEMLFAPSPPRSATPARRAAGAGLAGVFQPGFLVPPSPLGPSPLASSRSSQTPHSSTRTGTGNSDPNADSIPVRHDPSYSPPRFGLPRSVTPRTEASVRHPEDESFHSTHTADPTLRLPLDDWLEFAMSSMAAMGIPLTRATLEELHESEDESVAVAEALSPSSMRRGELDDAGVLDGVSQADDDSAGDSLSLSLSDVGSTPSPSRSEHSILFSTPPYAEITFTTAPAEPSSGLPKIDTSNLEWVTDEPGNISPVSHTSTGSESARAVDSLQNIAAAVRELNARTPIPSSSSGSVHPPGPPSIPAATPQPLLSGPQTEPTARSISAGSVSITFNEASPIQSTVPPLVVLPGDRDWFADSLLRAEYRHSFQQLRDDDYRALDEGEDVVLYGVGGEWEQIGRFGAESRATTDSAVPIEYDPDSEDLAARNKYIQFLLSFAGALRTPGPNRPPRWVETALRTLRGQVHGSGPRYPSDLYDAITRAEAELDRVPPPPVVPEHLSSTFVSSSSSGSSSIGSALPEEDEILEEFIRSVITPQPATPPRPTPLLTHVSNIVPWPVLPSPVSPLVRIRRSITPRSQVTSITTATTSTSAYSSIIPPLPRVRARTVEPHWLAVYLQRKWPVPDTYITRRTYSSPSALGPPMPYNWRPICHISPERLWEITNLAFRVDMPPPPPQPVLAPSPRAIAYSERTMSSSSSGTFAINEPIVVVDGRMTSHPNSRINLSQETIPPVPPPVPPVPTTPVPRPSETLSVTRSSRSRASLAAAHRYSLGAASGSDRPFPTARRVVTPVAASRRRTMMGIVGRLVGKERARTHSITSSRSPTPLIKSRFGLAGKIVDVTRRVFRNPRRRSRLTSTRSQRTVRGDA